MQQVLMSMGRVRWLVALLLSNALECGGATKAADTAHTDAMPTLLSFFKRLRTEAEGMKRLKGSMDKWCRDANKQKVSMVSSIQWQLDEAAISARQIASDEQRLQSELSLTNAETGQKEKELEDAISTANLAQGEFKTEHSQVERTLVAVQEAIGLVQAQLSEQGSGGDDADSISGLVQLTSGQMTDGKRIVQRSVAGGVRPQELLQTLQTFHGKLKQEASSATKEHQGIARKLWALTDRVNSSIMQTKSQAAAISMELTHRKREHKLLDRKSTVLSGIVQAIKKSRVASEKACTAEDSMLGEAVSFVTLEVDAVRDMVRTMVEPTSAQGSDLSSGMPDPPTFLQVKQSRPQGNVEDILKDDLQNMVEEDAPPPTQRPARTLQHRARAHTSSRLRAHTRAGKAQSDPLQDIKQFVKSKLNPELSNLDEVKEAKGLYTSLESRVQAKEKELTDRQKWCALIMRDASMDRAAVARSLNRTDAKKHLAEVVVREHEQNAAYYQEQHDHIVTQLRELSTMADQESQVHAESFDNLRAHTSQLMALIVDPGRELTMEERHNAEIARTVLQRIDRHQSALAQWDMVFTRQRNTLASADKAVQRALANEMKRNRRRLLQFKAEAQLLSSLAHAKSNDLDLSEQYREISSEVCSEERMHKLGSEEQELRHESQDLKKAFMSSLGPAPIAQE